MYAFCCPGVESDDPEPPRPNRMQRYDRPLNDESEVLALAQTIYELGGIEFGAFTLGRSTVNSPVYINPKVLCSHPGALRTAARVMLEETRSRQQRRRPQCGPFDLIAGVPLGGLNLATAMSLESDIPLIYVNPNPSGSSRIEGRYLPGQTVLIVDDLITSGGSITATAQALRSVGLQVTDAAVLIDRVSDSDAGRGEAGLNLFSILHLRRILNYYMSRGWISENNFQRSLEYLGAGAAD